MNFRRAALVCAAALCAGLSGCATDLGPRPPLVGADGLDAARTFAAGPARGIELQPDWWRAYNDPQLTALIEEALADSPNLTLAAARIAQAQAVVGRVNNASGATVDLDGSVDTVRQSLNNGFPDTFKEFLPHGWLGQARIAADVDFELDFFGRQRAALQAATSAVEAARAEEAAARLTLSTGVAGAYADLQRLYVERGAIDRSIAVRGQGAGLLQQRQAQGLENREPVARAEAGVAQARTDRAALDGQIELVRDQLSALVGKGPDRGLSITRPAAGAPQPIALPPGLSADLVGRRPDVAAARLRVESTASQEDLARLRFYPDIKLTALIGLQAIPIGRLLQGDSITGAAGPAIHLPIFDDGVLEADYRSRRAAYVEASGVYRQTLVQAFREVADALAQRRALDQQMTELAGVVRAREEAHTIADQRYQAGLSRALDVLSAEDQLLDARREMAVLQARAFNLDVALIRALGGGYQAPATQG